MNNFVKLVCLTIVISTCIITVKSSLSKDCGSKHAKNVYINITGCPPEMNPCKLYKGKVINVTVTFTVTENSPAVKTVVHGIIGGFPIPFPVDHPDACAAKEITCPLVSGKTYTYSSNIPVKASYPSIKLKVRWELRDDKDNDITCLEVPAQVTSGALEKIQNSLMMPAVEQFERAWL